MSAERDQFLEAHSRYQGYRDAAFDRTWEELHRSVPTDCDLRVMPIDGEALGFWQAIKSFGFVHPSGGFPWDDIFYQIHSTPRRFDIAIWDGPLLCGLGAGMASKGGENVTLRWVERFETPSNHLKGFVLEAVITAADHYARILNRPRLLLRAPLPGTEARYVDGFGFSLAPRRFGAIYYQRDVAQ